MIAWFLLAIGLVMIVEGLVYVLAPSMLEQILELLRQWPESARRQFGALIVVGGLMLIWLAFQFNISF